MWAYKSYKKWTIILIVTILSGNLISLSHANDKNKATSTFFSVAQDMPIMPGLSELKKQSFSFDKPEGKITEIVADLGNLNKNQVLYFYQITLPQFGWGKVSDSEFFRNNEYLKISFENNPPDNIVKIMIRPTR